MIESLNGLLTLILLIIFLWICIWAWSARNKDNFEKMAKLPLEEDSTDNNNEYAENDGREND